MNPGPTRMNPGPPSVHPGPTRVNPGPISANPVLSVILEKDLLTRFRALGVFKIMPCLRFWDL